MSASVDLTECMRIVATLESYNAQRGTVRRCATDVSAVMNDSMRYETQSVMLHVDKDGWTIEVCAAIGTRKSIKLRVSRHPILPPTITFDADAFDERVGS